MLLQILLLPSLEDLPEYGGEGQVSHYMKSREYVLNRIRVLQKD